MFFLKLCQKSFFIFFCGITLLSKDSTRLLVHRQCISSDFWIHLFLYSSFCLLPLLGEQLESDARTRCLYKMSCTGDGIHRYSICLLDTCQLSPHKSTLNWIYLEYVIGKLIWLSIRERRLGCSSSRHDVLPQSHLRQSRDPTCRRGPAGASCRRRLPPPAAAARPSWRSPAGRAFRSRLVTDWMMPLMTSSVASRSGVAWIQSRVSRLNNLSLLIVQLWLPAIGIHRSIADRPNNFVDVQIYMRENVKKNTVWLFRFSCKDIFLQEKELSINLSAQRYR